MNKKAGFLNGVPYEKKTAMNFLIGKHKRNGGRGMFTTKALHALCASAAK